MTVGLLCVQTTARPLADARCVRDGTASPAPILGHIFAGDAVSYAHIQAARFLAACFAVGAVLGFITGLVKERHG